MTGTTLKDDSASFITGNIVKPGDLIRNTTDGSYAHVTAVISETEITHTRLYGGSDNRWDINDAYSFNNLALNYTTLDKAYVPYIDQTATSTSVSVNITYVADRNMSTQVRRKGIIPFTTNTVSLTATGYTATAVRTTDSIVTEFSPKQQHSHTSTRSTTFAL